MCAGLFDGLLQGCIPVTFDIQTAENMYTWHWEQTFWKEVSTAIQCHCTPTFTVCVPLCVCPQVVVRLPMRPVGDRNMDPVQFLIDYMRDKPAEVRRKQELLRSRVFELQYSLDGPHEVAPISNMLHHNKPVDVDGYNSKIFNAHWNSSRHFHNNTWPLCGRGTNVTDLAPCRDAFDIIIDLSMGFHSGTGVKDERVGSTLACWDGKLDRKKNKCVM